jgi:hypothetical protein
MLCLVTYHKEMCARLENLFIFQATYFNEISYLQGRYLF